MKLRDDQSGLGHVLVLLLIVLLIGVGYGGYRVYTSKNKSKQSSSVGSVELSETQTIEEIRKLVEEIVATDGAPGVKVGDIKKKQYVVVKSEGFDYYVSLSGDTTSGFRIIDNEGNTDTSLDGQARRLQLYKSIISRIDKKMVDDFGFSKDLVTYESNAYTPTIHIFTKGNIVCNAEETFVGLDCGKLDEAQSLSKEIKPLVDAARKQTKANPTLVTSFIQPIQAGSNGYTVAEIENTNHGLQMYKNKAGEWIVATALSHQSPETCDNYEKDPDAAAAFEGLDECYDSSGSGLRKVRKP